MLATSVATGPAWTSPESVTRQAPSSPRPLSKTRPANRLAALTPANATLKPGCRTALQRFHRPTPRPRLPPAHDTLKTRPPNRLAAFLLAHTTLNTWPPTRLAAITPAHIMFRTRLTIHLAVFPSATSPSNTPPPEQPPAPRKPLWPLALLLTWLSGRPSSLHRPLRAPRIRPLLIPRRA